MKQCKLCNTLNPNEAVSCLMCGEAFDVTVTPKNVRAEHGMPVECKPEHPTLFLEEIQVDKFDNHGVATPSEQDGDIIRINRGLIEISENGGIIGREGTIARQYFENYRGVSRNHCTITKENDSWFVTRHKDSSPNVITSVGRMVLTNDIPKQLHNGDTLQLGDKLFFVMLKENENKHAAENTVSEMILQKNVDNNATGTWVVICPNCGKEYPVQNENATVNECSTCGDMCKWDISDTRPVLKNAN